MVIKKEGEGNAIKNLCERVPLKDVVRKPVLTVFEDDDMSTVEEAFVRHELYYLPVIDHDEKLVGLVSRRYVYKTLSPRKVIDQDMDYDPSVIIDGDSFYSKDTLDKFILRNIMRKDPPYLKEDEPVARAILYMTRSRTGCVVAVNQKMKVTGIFSSHEIVGFFASFLK